MKVLIFNTFSVPLVSPEPGERLRRAGQKIKELNPDLVFLQEIYTPWHKNLITESLADYPYQFIPRNGLFGAGGGLLFFSKIPIDEKRFYPFSVSGSWLDLSLSDKMARKGFMKLGFKLQKPFYFFHAHMTANYNNDFSLNNKYSKIIEKQLQELSEEIEKVPLINPCFIVGDLNVPPTISIFKRFLDKTQSNDLIISPLPTIRRKLYLLPIPVQFEKIDYLLFRGSGKIKCSPRYIFEEDDKLSDHVGIWAEIEI